MKEISLIIKWMGKESLCGVMARNMWVLIQMGSNKGMENLLLKMGLCTKGIL